MQIASHEGPRCQSCAMPMNTLEEFGTEAGGARSSDYCTYCYKNGAFTLQDITMREMCEFCVDTLVARKRMPRAQAHKMLRRLMPGLKRWAHPHH